MVICIYEYMHIFKYMDISIYCRYKDMSMLTLTLPVPLCLCFSFLCGVSLLSFSVFLYIFMRVSLSHSLSLRISMLPYTSTANSSSPTPTSFAASTSPGGQTGLRVTTRSVGGGAMGICRISPSGCLRSRVRRWDSSHIRSTWETIKGTSMQYHSVIFSVWRDSHS